LREHAKKVAALEAERLNPKPKPKAAPPANPLAPLPTQEYKVGNILAPIAGTGLSMLFPSSKSNFVQCLFDLFLLL
jgi:hypothetical protein